MTEQDKNNQSELMKKLVQLLGPRFIVIADVDFNGTRVLLSGAQLSSLPMMFADVIKQVSDGDYQREQ